MVRISESHRTEDVLMLFTYTENPPECRFFSPGFLRLGGLRMGYTENSSFPYSPSWALIIGLSGGQIYCRLSA